MTSISIQRCGRWILCVSMVLGMFAMHAESAFAVCVCIGAPSTCVIPPPNPSCPDMPSCIAACVGHTTNPLIIPKTDLKLLQPLDDDPATRLASGVGINIFFEYFNRSWPFILGTAVGIAVLQALVGSLMIMFSAGGGMKDQGKEKLMWALAGLLMIGLSGLILYTINPVFFQF